MNPTFFKSCSGLALALAVMGAVVPSVAAAQDPAAPAALSADPGEALGQYLRQLSVEPTNLEALTGAGKSALAVGDPNAAIGFLARAEELAPRDGRIKAAIGSALVQMQQPREALRLFDEATALGVPAADVASDRGLAYDLRGDNVRAQADYQTALRARSDDETIRRLALSKGMSGDRAGAVKLLDPLLRKQDKAAWRAQAFVLAMTGDARGAADQVKLLMPANQASAMAPFMARLASLTPDQKAMAVHFGVMPSGAATAAPPVQYAAATPPPVPAVAQPAPAQQVVTAVPVPERPARNTRRSEERVQLAARTPTSAPVPAPTPTPTAAPAQPVRVAQVVPAAAAMQAPPAPVRRGLSDSAIRQEFAAMRLLDVDQYLRSRARTESAARATPSKSEPTPVATPAPAAPVQLARAAPAPTQTPIPTSTPASTPTPTRAPAGPPVPVDVAVRNQLFAAADPARAVPSGNVPAPVYSNEPSPAARVELAEATRPRAHAESEAPAAETPPAPTPPVPTPSALQPSAVAGASVPVQLAAIPASTPTPPPAAAAAAAAAAAPVEAAAPVVAARSASEAPEETRSVAPRRRPGVVVPEPAAKPVRTASAEPTSRRTARGGDDDTVTDAPAKGKSTKSSRTADADDTAGAKSKTGKSATRLADASDAKGSRKRTADADVDDAAPAKNGARTASRGDSDDKDAKSTKRGSTRTADADDDAKSSKKGSQLASRDAETSSSKSRKAKASDDVSDDKGSSRHWVQVSGGSDASTLPKEYSKLKKKYPDLLAKRAGYATPLKDTNRLLVGPFKSDEEAQAFVNSSMKKGLQSFTFTSAKGQKIDKLASD